MENLFLRVFPEKALSLSDSCRRCANVDAAGASQIQHSFDPGTGHAFFTAQRFQRRSNCGVCIQSQVNPSHPATIQLLAQLLRPDDNMVASEILKAVGAHRIPFNKSIHTSTYYTLFHEKVNKFSSRNSVIFPVLLLPFPSIPSCVKSILFFLCRTYEDGGRGSVGLPIFSLELRKFQVFSPPVMAFAMTAPSSERALISYSANRNCQASVSVFYVDLSTILVYNVDQSTNIMILRVPRGKDHNAEPL